MTTEERESKSPQWRTDNLGKNVGLANVAGLGFGVWTEDGDNEYELWVDEIEILD